MSLFSLLSANRGRKILLAAVSAATLCAGIAAPTSASAFPLIPCWKLGTCGGYGYGYGAAAMAGGFALGAIAASAASANTGGSACWYEKRKSVDDYGNLYIRKIRVCE